MTPTRAVRIVLFFLLVIFSATLTRKARLQDTNCCPIPTTETSSNGGAGATSGDYASITKFTQTISNPSNSVFDGQTVKETAGNAGSDTCYFNGAPFNPQTTISGGTWPVAGGPLSGQSNKWGYDYVGWTATGVDYYRTQAPAHGNPLPCGWTFYQNMEISCPGGTSSFVQYASNNVLTATINATSVTNCRIGTCGTINR